VARFVDVIAPQDAPDPIHIDMHKTLEIVITLFVGFSIQVSFRP